MSDELADAKKTLAELIEQRAKIYALGVKGETDGIDSAIADLSRTIMREENRRRAN